MNARDLKFTADLIKLGVFCLVSVIVTGGSWSLPSSTILAKTASCRSTISWPCASV